MTRSNEWSSPHAAPDDRRAGAATEGPRGFGSEAHDLTDEHFVATITEALVRRAWLRHGIRRHTAEDLVQATFLVFLNVRHRYPVKEEHTAILVGIFRHECLRHVRSRERERRRFERYCSRRFAARAEPWHDADAPGMTRSVIETLMERDSSRAIADAIGELRPPAHRIATLIASEGLHRTELIDHFAVNENTMDSRLRACRLELKRLLRKKHIAC